MLKVLRLRFPINEAKLRRRLNEGYSHISKRGSGLLNHSTAFTIDISGSIPNVSSRIISSPRTNIYESLVTRQGISYWNSNHFRLHHLHQMLHLILHHHHVHHQYLLHSQRLPHLPHLPHHPLLLHHLHFQLLL